MRSRAFTAILRLAFIAAILPVSAFGGSKGDDVFLGRWDITATGSQSGRVRICWLELTRDNGALKGRFNSGSGAVFDVTRVSVENGELKFQYPPHPWEHPLKAGGPPNNQHEWQGTMKNGRLVGTAVVNGETLPWTGVRGPTWPATPPKRKPGKPIDLIGNDLSGWLCQDNVSPSRWSIKDGIMMNEGKSACNIYTKKRFNDFKLEVEFNVDPHSNSGVYLRGRYEVQIWDAPERPLDIHSQGAIYGFIVPSVRAEKPPGEWQTFEITLIANRVTVIENGTKIIDSGEVPGVTGGALDADEKGPGPILLQGDHGRVQFRKVSLTPLN
jgi:hypothetical protein